GKDRQGTVKVKLNKPNLCPIIKSCRGLQEMKYPGNIIGPKFAEGDLITFMFDGAELTIRSVIVPRNSHGADRLCSIKDFRNINTRDWDTNDQEHPSIELLLQRWCFEDSRSLDDIAECEVYVGLVEVGEADRKANTLLSTPTLESLMLSWHHYSFGAQHNEKYEQDPTWPALSNRYHGRSIAQDHIDWFVLQLNLSLQVQPVQAAMIPINSRFVLMTFIDLQSLHYAGRANPYSNTLLKQFEKDLFEEFLSHIRIDYSPETIATIKSLKNKTLA
ncbi:MAG: hypothetical protein ABW044_10475, partial [Cellvibrio sp.]